MSTAFSESGSFDQYVYGFCTCKSLQQIKTKKGRDEDQQRTQQRNGDGKSSELQREKKNHNGFDMKVVINDECVYCACLVFLLFLIYEYLLVVCSGRCSRCCYCCCCSGQFTLCLCNEKKNKSKKERFVSLFSFYLSRAHGIGINRLAHRRTSISNVVNKNERWKRR